MQGHAHRNTKNFCFRLEVISGYCWTGHWWANITGWLNYPHDTSMKRAYVVIGCTRKVISSRDQEGLFPAQGPGENSRAILCIIRVICVQPRQVQMRAGGGQRRWKNSGNKRKLEEFFLKQGVTGDIFAVYQCTGVITEGGELFMLTKKLK